MSARCNILGTQFSVERRPGAVIAKRGELSNRSRNGAGESPGAAAIFGGSLIRVKRFVSALQKFLCGFSRLVIGPAASEIHADFLAGAFDFKALEASQDVTNFLCAAFRQYDHEFVATETHREVRAANSALQAIRERADHDVARIVAELIVALLQVIKVQKKNRERTRVTPRARNFLEKPLLA